MKDRYLLTASLLVLACMIIVPFPAPAQVSHQELQGSWAGALKVQGMDLRLVMNISFNQADSMVVTFDSPDQGAMNLPTSKVIVKDDSIIVSSKRIGGKFSGKMSVDRTLLSGTWKQSGMSFPLVLVRQEKKLIINRPQEPKHPFPYRSEEVTFPNAGGGFDLAGTLTLPEKGGPFPAAILITGSGPQNRDEELMGHKPFLVLSDYLTRQGIAVLRYDDRGVAKSGGDFKTATTLDFATDAEAALDFLKKRSDIDSRTIGFIGHSEGGIIAPVVASRRKDVAFVVLMAGPGITGEQILLLQSALISRAEKADEKSIKTNDQLNREMYAVLKKTSDNARAEHKLRALFTGIDKKHSGDTTYHKIEEPALNAQLKTITSPWFRCFLTLDPQDYLTRVSCPLLAINGSLDLQVPPRENLEAIERAMIFGGNARFTTEELPGLNHLFQHAATGSPNEYSKIEETIAPSALEMIGKWILANVGN
ncbi:MAG: alpha/beta fold hydrolase [Bacteroidota bacterium]